MFARATITLGIGPHLVYISKCRIRDVVSKCKQYSLFTYSVVNMLITGLLVDEGVSQNYARKWQIPIDKLDFQYEMLTTEGETKLMQPSEGAYIYVRVPCCHH